MLAKTPLYHAWKRGLSTGLKKQRFNRIMQHAVIPEGRPFRVLEIGCANGKDVIQFLLNIPNCEIHAVDLKPQDLPAEVTFHQADASKLPFVDGDFDLVISIGLLEHIEPIEKLSAIIKEMRRVGKACAAIVPCISTWLEPHALRFRWPLKHHKQHIFKNPSKPLLRLNYFTDHTWTKFEGFHDADLVRFYYFFPLVQNLLIFAGPQKS